MVNTSRVCNSGDKIIIPPLPALLVKDGPRYRPEILWAFTDLSTPWQSGSMLFVLFFVVVISSPYLLHSTRSNIFVEFLERCDFWLHAMCLWGRGRKACVLIHAVLFLFHILILFDSVFVCVCFDLKRSVIMKVIYGCSVPLLPIMEDKNGGMPLCWCWSIFRQLRFSSLICVLSVSDDFPRLLL